MGKHNIFASHLFFEVLLDLISIGFDVAKRYFLDLDHSLGLIFGCLDRQGWTCGGAVVVDDLGFETLDFKLQLVNDVGILGHMIFHI